MKISKNFKKIGLILLLLIIIGGLWWLKTKPSIIQTDLETIYNRYSKYLDTKWNGKGWSYEVPSSDYKEIGLVSDNSLRLQATLATFYRFRTEPEAQEKIQRALEYVLIELSNKQSNFVLDQNKKISTRSFNEAIGAYLSLQLLKNKPELFSTTSRDLILKNIKDMYPWILEANDTENRALLSAAYSLAILKHSLMNFSVAEQEQYLNLIRQKVDLGLQSVGADNLYREGKNKQFTEHYHLVTANMLVYLGEEIPNENYLIKAKAMFEVLNSSLVANELLKNIEPARPRGQGLQNILLKTVAQKYQSGTGIASYWREQKIGLGFIEPANPDRLVWYDWYDSTYNDDYSLANMAELFWNNLND